MKKKLTKNGSKIAYDQKKAFTLIAKNGIKLTTIQKWEKEGLMPARYFEKKDVYSIDGVSILQKRINSGLSQGDFIIKFNERFSMNLSQVLLSNWENGKCHPQNAYRNLLNEFYSK